MMFADKFFPFDTGGLIGFAQNSKGANVATVFIEVVFCIKLRYHGLAMAAGRRPENEQCVFMARMLKAVIASCGVFENQLRSHTAHKETIPCGGALHLLVNHAGG